MNEKLYKILRYNNKTFYNYFVVFINNLNIFLISLN